MKTTCDQYPLCDHQEACADEARIRNLEAQVAALTDHPEMDGTDGAHPAWWRGCDHGVKMAALAVTEPTVSVGTVASLELQQAREYVAKLTEEERRLRTWVADLQSGMWVNCIYCGHRYGPGDTTPVSMADALRAHAESCAAHPLSVAKAQVAALTAERDAAKEALVAALDDGGEYARCTADVIALAATARERFSRAASGPEIAEVASGAIEWLCDRLVAGEHVGAAKRKENG